MANLPSSMFLSAHRLVFFFILFLFLSIIFSKADASSLDDVVFDVRQLKQETVNSVSHHHARRWLLVKVSKALVHSRKSQKYSNRKKTNKAKKQLGKVWNDVHSYYKRLIIATSYGKVSNNVSNNLEQMALGILNRIESMGSHSLLVEIEELTIDTDNNITHKKTRNFLKKKLGNTRKHVLKGVKFSIRDKESKAQKKYINARNQTQLYIDRLESAVVQGKVNQAIALGLISKAQQIVLQLNGYISGNQAPVANAGNDIAAKLGDSITLDGSESFDLDEDTITYSWIISQKPADSSATLINAELINPVFTADVIGKYTIQLIVNDSELSSTSDELVVIVSRDNTPPTANAGTDQNLHVGETVILDGSESSDIDGDNLSYAWLLTQKPENSVATLTNPSVFNPNFVADQQGIYIAELVVNDGEIDSLPDTVVITMGNAIPIANAGNDQSVSVGSLVTLDGSLSFDMDGDPLEYAWYFNSLPELSTANLNDELSISPNFTADVAGQYVISLSVNDGFSESVANTVIVNAEIANTRPISNAGMDQSLFVNDTVSISGSASSDADDDSLTYQWALITKPESSLASIDTPQQRDTSFILDLPGEYIVQLIVNDGTVDSEPDQVIITTKNTRPVADPGNDETYTVGDTVILNGSGSSDVDNDTLTYQWSLLSKPENSSVEFSGETSVSLEFVPDLLGFYVAQLIVNDGQLDSVPVTSTVTAEPETPLEVVISSPERNSYTNLASIDIDGHLNQSASLAMNGSAISVNDDNSFSQNVTLVEGSNIYTFLATNVLNQTATSVLQIIRDTLVPPPANIGLIDIGSANNGQITISGGNNSIEAGAQIRISNNRTGESVVATAGENGQFTANLTGVTGDTFTIIVIDRAGNNSTSVEITSEDTVVLPPDPSTVAPSLPPTDLYSIADTTAFLYEGGNPIQTGVTEGTIDKDRIVVLKGKILDEDSQVLSGVKITINKHPELGQTLSRSDGHFDMVANGGGVLTINYTKEGYLPAQRSIKTGWNEYQYADDVILISLDDQVTEIDLANISETFQVAQGSMSIDSAGERQATVLFPQNTQATMTLPDGSQQSLSTLNVRATEYTVGENGQQRMPAPLPSMSGYTYAVELSVDEAVAAGATRVGFDQPLPMYVDNFLNFPAGEAVPLGWYDFDKEAWIPEQNGRVIEILSESNGQAVLDVVGDGSESTTQQLSDLGITTDELRKLAELYDAGKSLWRVQIEHFTPWDLNWPYGPPGDANPPPSDGPDGKDDNNPDDDCSKSGCVIGAESQTLGEDINLVGTPYSLHYRSDRVPGRKSPYALDINLSGDSIPSSLQRIRLTVYVAGQEFEQEFEPETNQSYEYIWDGKDAYGRVVSGLAEAEIKLEYIYGEINYLSVFGSREAAANPFFSSFARAGTAEVIRQRSGDGASFSFERNWTESLGNIDQRNISGLGGLSLSAHHVYDETNKVIHLGSGNTIGANDVYSIIRSFAGGGLPTAPPCNLPPELCGGEGPPPPPGSGYPTEPEAALGTYLKWPTGITEASDGTLYIIDSGSSNDGISYIRYIDQEGIIHTIDPVGVDPDIRLDFYDIAEAPDGSFYITNPNGHQIHRFTPEGGLTRIAGAEGDVFGDSEDGTLAINARVGLPRGITVAPDGTIYFADDLYNKVKKIDPSGKIYTVAGTGRSRFGGDGGPAISADLRSPSDVELDRYGNIYVADSNNHRVRRINQDGIIETVAGSGPSGLFEGEFSGDGGPATEARFFGVQSLAFGADDSLFIVDRHNRRIRTVNSAGIISTIAGFDDTTNLWTDGGYGGDGGPATSASFAAWSTGITVSAQGSILIADSGNGRIREIRSSAYERSDNLFTSKDGSEVYRFDPNGKHIETLHAYTNAKLQTFAYNEDGYLISVTDVNDNKTLIERNSSNQPTTIISPYGQRTELTLDANNFVNTITEPGGNNHQLTLGTEGLLTTYVDRNGNTYNYQYDSLGLLLKDTSPNGGGWDLSRTDNADGHTVTMMSGEGREQSFKVESLDTGDYKRTVEFEDETSAIMIQKSTGENVTTQRDGSVFSVLQASDPRFGMSAPTSTSRMTTPAGLVFNSTTTRDVNLEQNNDPLSLSSFTETETVNGRASVFNFNSTDRIWTFTSAAGRTDSLKLDQKARPVSSQIEGLLPETFTYDIRGRFSSLTAGEGAESRTSILSYDSNGYLSSTTDPLGRTTTFTNDALGRVTRQTFADGRAIESSYDANGNLDRITTPSGMTHVFNYTSMNQESKYSPPSANGVSNPATTYDFNLDKDLTKIIRPDGKVIDFTYHANKGQLTRKAIPRGDYVYSYVDSSGKISTITTPDNDTLTYTHDGPLVTEIQWGGEINSSVNSVYNNDLVLQSRSINGNHVINFNYDDDLLLTQAGDISIGRESQKGGLINGTTLDKIGTSHTYNGFAEMTENVARHDGNTFYHVSYTHDKLGNITRKIEIIDGIATSYDYSYDLVSRLIEVKTNGNVTASYNYDDNGNRNGGTYDDQDRLLTWNTNSYSYTANGELTNKTASGATTNYTYDVLGNLVKVTLPGDVTIDYVIDGQDRRVGKKVNGSLVQGFLYKDQLNPIAELDSNGNVLTRFVYGDKLNIPAYMEKGGKIYRIISDHLGSPKLVVDASNGEVAQRIDYDVWGNIISNTNPGFQPFGFAGGLYDQHTNLVRFGARDYDPETGRWTNKDPIKFAGGDANLYGYVLGNPVTFNDTEGLFIGGIISKIVNTLSRAARGSGPNAGATRMSNNMAGRMADNVVAPFMAGTAIGNLPKSTLCALGVDPFYANLAADALRTGAGVGAMSMALTLAAAASGPPLLVVGVTGTLAVAGAYEVAVGSYGIARSLYTRYAN